MGSMSKLRRLEITDNVIDEVPAEFGNMTNLKVFNGWGNTFSCLPRSLIFQIGGSGYTPACTNRTIQGYLTSRIAKKGTCEGFGKLPPLRSIACFYRLSTYFYATCSLQNQRHRDGLHQLRAHEL
jgi:hypothetical protein